MRRKFACLLVVIAVLATGAGASAEQTYPIKPIRMIVPFPAGSATDASARFLAQQLNALTGQPVVVDNKGGANGVIAAQAAAQAPADGYTIFYTTMTTQAANPHVYKKLPYDPRKDFAVVALVNRGPSVVLVRNAPGQPRTLAELTAKAKTGSGKVSYASGNMSSRVAAEVYAHEVGATLLHVPYKGTPPALTDLVAGQVDVLFGDLSSAMPMIKDGKLRVLAVTGTQRLSVIPNVPTMRELGAPVDLTPWSAVYLPAKTPRPVVNRLGDLLAKILRTPEAKVFFERNGAALTPLPPDQAAAFDNAEYEAWGNAIRMAGIEPE